MSNREQAFNTVILDEAIAHRRTERERLRQQTLQMTLDLLDQLSSQYGLERVILFGSIIMPGRFHEHSDVDLAVEEMQTPFFFDLMADISFQLGREVDLINLNQCHFAEQIRRDGIVWTKKQ